MYYMQCCILQTHGIYSIISNEENGSNFGGVEVYSLSYFECVFWRNIKLKIILKQLHKHDAWRDIGDQYR